MKNFRNIIGGRQSKIRGDNAENLLHREAMRTGWTVIKIPMGAKMISAVKMIRVRTDFDFVFIKGPRVLFVDSKTTKAKYYSCAQKTDHQVNKLREIERHGHQAGYIIQFSESKKVIFFKGSQLYDLQNNSSLKPEHGILIGENGIINLDRIYGEKILTGTLYKGPVPQSDIGV